VLTFAQSCQPTALHLKARLVIIDRFAGSRRKWTLPRAQGLALSSIGIGTYLGNPDEATDTNYTNAVVRAVQLGVNVIDSAANYRFQRSERSIGRRSKHLQTSTAFAR
jgi:diketogulonate reductase-like aldo/keto reductase